MTKICEHEKVNCPYCGYAHVTDEGGCTIETKMSEKNPAGIRNPGHIVRCNRCQGIFAVSCEC